MRVTDSYARDVIGFVDGRPVVLERGDDGTTGVRELTTGRFRCSLPTPGVLAPSGDVIVRDLPLTVVDARTCEVLRREPPRGGPPALQPPGLGLIGLLAADAGERAFVVAANGAFAASARSDGVHVFDLATAKETTLLGRPIPAPPKQHPMSARIVAFSPDGALVAITRPRASADRPRVVAVHESRSGKLRGELALDVVPDARLTPLGMTNDGAVIVEQGREVFATDLRSHMPTKTFLPAAAPRGSQPFTFGGLSFFGSTTSLRWSADGSAFAITRDEVHLFDAASGEERGSWAIGARGVALSPEGRQILIQEASGRTHLTQADARLDEPVPGHARAVTQLAFSPRGKLIATIDGATLILWDSRDGRMLRRVELPGVSSVAFGADGAKLFAALGDGRVVSTTVDTRSPPTTLDDDHATSVRLTTGPGGLVVSKRGGRVAEAVTVYGASGRTRTLPIENGDDLLDTTFARDGHTVAVLRPRSLSLYDADGRAGARRVVLPPLGSYAVARVLAAGDDLIVAPGRAQPLLIDPRTGKVARRYRPSCQSVAVLPDGSRLACLDGETLRWIDVTTGDLREHPLGRAGEQAHLSPDGATLAITHADTTVTLFRVSALGGSEPKRAVAPLRTSPVGDWTELSVGCLQRQDGAVICFSPGARPSGSARRGNVPANAAIPGLGKVVQLASSTELACARRDDGALLCWGRWAKPGGVERQRDVVHAIDVAVHEARACVVEELGTVRCWSQVHRSEERARDLLPGMDDVVRVAVGRSRVCGLRRDATVVCAKGPPSAQPERTAQPIAGVRDVVDLAAGHDHVCARTSAGAVFCWGSGGKGQLGEPVLLDREEPVLVAEGVTSLSVDEDLTCVTVDGRLRCTGEKSRLFAPDFSDRLVDVGPASGRAIIVDGGVCVLDDGALACTDGSRVPRR